MRTEKRRVGASNLKAIYDPEFTEGDDRISSLNNIRQFNRVQDINRFTELEESDPEDVYLNPYSKYPIVHDHLQDNVLADELTSRSRSLLRQSPHGVLANPPPLDTPDLRAEVIEYPSYEVLSFSKSFSNNKRNSYMPQKDFDGFIFKRRRRR